MSNTDSFVDEVNDDLRRDRLFGLMKRYGWIVILAILLLVGLAAWTEWTSSRAQTARQIRGDAMIAAMSLESPEARAEALGAIDGPAARLSEAAMYVEAGDSPAAIAIFRTIAETETLSPAYRDLAALKLAMLPEFGTPEERRGALTPLATPGRPYRLIAAEQIALSELERGERDAAIAALSEILTDASVTPGQSGRIEMILTALGAEIPTLPQNTTQTGQIGVPDVTAP